MRKNPLVAFVLDAFARKLMNAQPMISNKGLNKDDNLPRGFPGAKLARKAAQGGLGVKHKGFRRNAGEWVMGS